MPTDPDDCFELIEAAHAVIRRWDHDDVDAGAMDRDIEQLRLAVIRAATVEAERLTRPPAPPAPPPDRPPSGAVSW